MKKLLYFSLTFLFLFNLAGYYIAFPVISSCVKQATRVGMEAGVLKKQLVLVKIPGALLKTPNARFQMTDENEFEFQGKMYDVSSREIRNGDAYFYCYADYQEDNLYTDLDNHVKIDAGINTCDHKGANGKTVISPLKEYLKTSYICPEIACTGNIHAMRYASEYFASIHQPILVPPPKA